MKEHFGERAGNLDHNWLLQTSQPCYTGTSYLQALPDINALIPREAITTSPRVDYAINFTTPGTHTIWIRGYPANAAGDSVYVGLADNPVEVSGFAPGQWSWANVAFGGSSATLPLTTTGLYTISLWMRDACVACASTGCC